MTRCCALHSHITDSRFYGHSYTTAEARRIFCDSRRFQRWLEVEAALALSQAELGIIPAPAAQRLAATADLRLFDLKAIEEDIGRTGHSLIPLLNEWQRVAGEDAGGYIHFGATTQDIQDTAQSLELADVLAAVDRDCSAIVEQLTDLATRFRDLVMVGRTHGQPALPTTLGLKIAVWLDELLRGIERLTAARGRVLVSQLFGGVGTMAALGAPALALLDRFSQRLGLESPLTSWHTARDRLAELMAALAIVAGLFAKMANEIAQLSRAEIGELEEPFHMGKIGSTTMPHKRNPEMCEQVVVLARLIRESAALGFEALINEHERDYRAVRLEWVSVTESGLYFCGSTGLMQQILGGLIVHSDRIAANVRQHGSLLTTEALMFLLADGLGKHAAHRHLYEAAMAAHEQGKPLLDELLARPEINTICSTDSLARALRPEDHVGLAGLLTDRMVARARAWLGTQPAASNRPGIDCPLALPEGGCGLEKGKHDG